ncbi:MAG: hypothetical protein EOO61_23185 [Hymenobacter sp.]|nr:MAG: hypothetical protein EOO61_23185 [Hymenobacter sp.]
MNTLKLKLLAASMFACSAAFAQSAGGQISGPPVTRTPTNTPNEFTPQAIGTRPNSSAQGPYFVDSYVLQNGDSQYASVDQKGFYNTADIYQNYNNAAGANANNATQVQNNDGRDGFMGARNIAYIAQNGSASSASQNQLGTGNVASTTQGTGTHNSADQQQTGKSNSADISQIGSNSDAIQFQNGNSDTARIIQGAGSGNYAEQRQTGGDNNQAYTSQSASEYSSFSYTQQNGNNNQATVNQQR